MSNEIKKDSINNINGKKQENNMNFIIKLTRTFFRLFSLQTLVIFLIILMGSFMIIWNFFSGIEDKLYSSIISSIILTYIVKFFEYYD